MLKKIVLLLILTLVSCREERGDQGNPAAAEREQDIIFEFGNIAIGFDYLDENIQEMTQENTQLEGDDAAIERINEDEVDDEIASAEKHESFPVWKILLVVAGCAIGLALLVGAVILVVKSRNNKLMATDNNMSKDKEDESESTSISCLGKTLNDKEDKQIKVEKKEDKESQRNNLVNHIRYSLAENFPV